MIIEVAMEDATVVVRAVARDAAAMVVAAMVVVGGEAAMVMAARAVVGRME
tara:strand:- start:92 stop:244 length:153 start_codon:yes stop_codon:yes gene_type:complete